MLVKFSKFKVPPPPPPPKKKKIGTKSRAALTAPADPRCSSQLQANTQSHIWFLCTTRNGSIVIRHSLPPGLCCYVARLRTSCGRGGGGEGSGHPSTFRLSLGWNADLTNQNSCLKMTSWKLFLSRLSVPPTTRYGKSLRCSMLPLSYLMIGGDTMHTFTTDLLIAPLNFCQIPMHNCIL